ncbi:MAG: hypothetical protein HY330_05140 [Chloroflexi bacterium]|nr:hypothetical protein [Chloroflexota bacterium]
MDAYILGASPFPRRPALLPVLGGGDEQLRPSGRVQAAMLASLQYPVSARAVLGRSSIPAAARVRSSLLSVGSSCRTSLASGVTPTATMTWSSLTTAWTL